ncbi:MAG: PIG-L deacetylase family protein [Actinomycetes bacterium]
MGALTDWVSVIDDAVFDRLVIVSPHFDDAVLSAGQLLAKHHGATVITVMGGQRNAGSYDEVSWWDALGGFQPGDDVVVARRAEDKAALDILGARQRWLDFADHQYDADGPGKNRPSAESIADALDGELDAIKPTAVMVPMGLANPDHVLTHDACRLVIDRRRPEAFAWFAYAEAGYLHIPGILAWRIGRLLRSGLWPTPAPLVADTGRDAKREALGAYVTQLPALAADWGYDAAANARIAESFWRLAPPPAGWERLAE